MNRAERIFRMHSLLRSKTPVTLQRLKDETGCSLSSIKRDIEYMRDYMNAPIVYDRGANCYAYKPNAPGFELPGLWFNTSELYALLTIEQLLASVQPGFLSHSIGPLKARIHTLLQQSGHSADTVAARVKLIAVAQRAQNEERFGHIAAAVLQQRVLHIDYHSREKNEITQRRVHPCLLLHYRSNWYLIAYCELKQALRSFSLDRITNPVKIDEPVRQIDDKQVQRYLHASFGIFAGEAKAWAVLRFSARAARWVADEQWHPDQIGQWRGAEYELQLPYSDTRELLMEILKYGPEVEVLAPAELRAEVGERLRVASEKYF